jgi:hypothetical protein
MVQLPNLDTHDIPGGVVQQDAFCIQWLQDILDFWYHMVPFSASVTSSTLNVTANVNSVAVPTDFIVDVRNGYLVQTISGDNLSYRRVLRVPLQKWLNRSLMYQRQAATVLYPSFYMIQGSTMKVTPTPTITATGTLWYYQLPPALQADDKPLFPNDYVCIEYIRIRALEWSRIVDPGTAQKFCEKIVGGMKAAGLMNEPEDDEIPFDEQVYSKGGRYGSNSYSWMEPR